MSGHATAESLSLYLDAVLPAVERRQIDEHIERCSQCRQRLDGLRRVVSGLGRLPTAAPPEDLAARVVREIDLRGRRSRWSRLLEGGLPAPALGSPPLHILALVLALGAIIYLFAQGLEMSRERSTRIVLPGAESVILEGSRDPAEPQAARAAGSDLYLLGGHFHRAEGVWVEEGLDERAPDFRVVLETAGAEAAAIPEVAELAALGAPLRLRVGDQVVEIAFDPASPVGE